MSNVAPPPRPPEFHHYHHSDIGHVDCRRRVTVTWRWCGWWWRPRRSRTARCWPAGPRPGTSTPQQPSPPAGTCKSTVSVTTRAVNGTSRNITMVGSLLKAHTSNFTIKNLLMVSRCEIGILICKEHNWWAALRILTVKFREIKLTALVITQNMLCHVMFRHVMSVVIKCNSKSKSSYTLMMFYNVTYYVLCYVSYIICYIYAVLLLTSPRVTLLVVSSSCQL